MKTLDRVAVTTHVGADGDAIGASAALVRLMRHLGAEAVFCHAEAVPEYLSWLLPDEALSELPPGSRPARRRHLPRGPGRSARTRGRRPPKLRPPRGQPLLRRVQPGEPEGRGDGRDRRRPLRGARRAHRQARRRGPLRRHQDRHRGLQLPQHLPAGPRARRRPAPGRRRARRGQRAHQPQGQHRAAQDRRASPWPTPCSTAKP